MKRAMTTQADLRHLDTTAIEILDGGDFQFGERAVNPDAVVDCARLLLLTAGAIDYTIETTTIRMAAPAMIYVPSWTRRHWLVAGAAGGRVIYVEFILPGDTRLSAPAVLQPVPETPSETKVMRRIVRSLRDRGKAPVISAIELKAVLARFLVQADRLHDLSEAQPVRPEQHVETAIDWLHEHLADPDALQNLPKITRLTPDYLRRLFKQHTGMAPKQYLTVQRMRAARYQLRQTDLLVKEVAAATGYGDAFHFSRQYRRFWGKSPASERAS